MGKHRHHHHRHKKAKLIWLYSGVGLIVAIVGLAIVLACQPADLELVEDYKLPEFTKLADKIDVGASSYAVAVDGEVAADDAKVDDGGTGANDNASGTGEATNAKEGTDNSPDIHPTASTAKMILGLAIMQAKPFEKGETGETIKITPEHYDKYVWYTENNGSNSAVEVGEEISEFDALMSVFLVSSNNMADTLAVWAFGSMDDYRDYATKMLEDWGINDTTIGVDASGFDASTTSTTADLARIGHKVLSDPVLAEIVRTQVYTVPVAGKLENTNQLLGRDGIIGVKTGFTNEAGYCLVAGYLEGKHIVTATLLGAPDRGSSFSESLEIIETAQEVLAEQTLVRAGEVVGHYDSWWTGPVDIKADQDLSGIGWGEAKAEADLLMEGQTGTLKITIAGLDYRVPVTADDYATRPSLVDRLKHLFGWTKEEGDDADSMQVETPKPEEATADESQVEVVADFTDGITTNAPSNNCTIKYGALMLVNPNFKVEDDFIAARRGELVSLASTYGINEHNTYNGDNLLDARAAEKINQMIKAYEAENPGHTMETLSCFRAVGTNCGRLCAATGTSDHHTGLTCDLADPEYGVSLDTSAYDQHPDWQWLKANSYKYGFIDRFPEAWAGGSMDEPINVDENGSTGLFETWHYRYVGVDAATEIATGKYNNGQYDSLEHYLKARGLVADLKSGRCE